jgi:hypothetical protein
MPFKKGKSGNPAGRPRKPNRATTELKGWIQSLIDDNRDQLETDLKAMEPKERWQIIERLMQYTIPKMQVVEANLEFDNLSDENVNKIATDLLNIIQNDNTRKRNKN